MSGLLGALKSQKKRAAATALFAMAAAVLPAANAFAQAMRSQPNVPPAISSGQVPVNNPGSISSSAISVQLVPQTVPPDAKKRSAVVRSVRVDGTFPELESQTATLTATIQGRRITLADAFKFAASLQQAYADAGYPLVNAVLEPQFFGKGEIRIKIIDGFIERIDVSGVPQDLRALVNARLSPIVDRRHITLNEIQRHILLIGEIPGVTGSTKTKLGDQFGGVVLLVAATETPFTYGLGVNNYLPREYGTFLFSQGFSINNTFGFGETLHAEVSSSDDFGQFFVGRAKAQAFSFGGIVPVGPDGFTVSANYFKSLVSPTPQPGIFGPAAPASEGLHGDFQQASIRANYPVFLTLQQSLRLQLGFDFVDDKEDVAPVPVLITPAGMPIYNIFHDQYEDVRLAGEWSINFPWSWGGKAISALIYNHGIDGIAGDVFVPLSRPGASPDFNKLSAEVRVKQPLPEGFVFAGLARAQTSLGESLMESEELQLAGPDVLSGFSLGTLYVDTGAVGRAELQRPIAFPIGGGAAVAAPYIFGAWGDGRFEQVFFGQNPNVRAASYGGGIRTNANFAGWPFDETLNLEAARVTSNVPFAREGYVGSFTYTMKYAGDPFSAVKTDLLHDPDPEPQAVDFSTSGFYGGLNTGYAFDGSAKINSTGSVTSSALDAFLVANAAAVSAANITGSAPSSLGSPIGGAQFGYNFITGNWLLGAETDIDGAGAAAITTSSRSSNASVAGGATTETVTTLFEDGKSVNWLGTLRGRAGLVVNPDIVPYITGGLAYGGVGADTRASQTWADPAAGPLAAGATSSVATGHYSGTLIGWTLGGGIEWMFAPGLSLKGEYLFYDLGGVSFPSGTLTTTLVTPALSNVVISNSSAHFDGHIIRIGLNYHFGAPAPLPGHPIKELADDDDPPAPSWDGVYAGVNSGYAWGFSNSSTSNTASIASNALDQQLSPPGFVTSLAPASAFAIEGPSNPVLGGFTGGAQLGYNLVLNRGLIGIETDMQGSGAKGHDSYVTNSTFNPGSKAGTTSLFTQVDNSTALDWLGTLRGRAGVFVQPQILVYATGGLAYGETSSNTSIDQQFSAAVLPLLKTSGSVGNYDKVMAGWTAGGGFEWKFSRNLSLKAEYLLYDLGRANYGSSPLLTTFGVSNAIIPFTSDHYNGQIMRIGLNYYFSP